MKMYTLIALLLGSLAAGSTSTPVGGKVPKYADAGSSKELAPHSFLSPRPLEVNNARRGAPHAGSVAGGAQVLYQMLEQRVDPSVFDAVIATIRENVRTNLNSTVHSVEGQLQAKTNALAACAANHGFHSGTTLPTEYNAAEQAYNDAVDALDQSENHRDTKCSTKTTTCRQRDDKGLALYNSVVGSTQCSLPEQPAGGTVYDETFVLSNVDDWVATIELQHGQWSSFKDSCAGQTAACATAEAAAAANETAKVQECSDLETAKVAGKSAYDGCYDTAKGELDGYDWQAEVDAQKSSVEQVETLICYIKVAVKDMQGGGSARSDGATACSLTGAQYQCACTSKEGPEYPGETYDVGVTEPAVPAKDAAWDTKGCAVAQVCSGFMCPTNFQKKHGIENEVGHDAETCCEHVGFYASGSNIPITLAETHKGYRCEYNTIQDLPSEHFQWGAGEFQIWITVTPIADARITPIGHGAGMVLSNMEGSAPYKGIMLRLWDDGRIHFRLQSSEAHWQEELCIAQVPGGWKADEPVRLHVGRYLNSNSAMDTLKINVNDSTEKECQVPPKQYNVNNNIPMRVCGQPVGERHDVNNIDAFLSNMRSTGR